MARVQVPSLKCFASAFLKLLSPSELRGLRQKRILTPF